MQNIEKIRITTRTLNQLKFNDQQLIPAIIQDYKSKDVLMKIGRAHV